MKISSVSKKVLASALSAAMVVAFAPTVAFAGNGTKVAVTLDLNGGTVASGNASFPAAEQGDAIKLPVVEKGDFEANVWKYDDNKDGAIDDKDAAILGPTFNFTVPTGLTAVTLKAFFQQPAISKAEVNAGELVVTFKGADDVDAKGYSVTFYGADGSLLETVKSVDVDKKTTDVTAATTKGIAAAGTYRAVVKDKDGKVVETKLIEVAKVEKSDSLTPVYAVKGQAIDLGQTLGKDNTYKVGDTDLIVSGTYKVTGDVKLTAVATPEYANATALTGKTVTITLNNLAATGGTAEDEWNLSISGDNGITYAGKLAGVGVGTVDVSFDPAAAGAHFSGDIAAGTYTVTLTKTIKRAGQADDVKVTKSQFTISEIKVSAGEGTFIPNALTAQEKDYFTFNGAAAKTPANDVKTYVKAPEGKQDPTQWEINGKKCAKNTAFEYTQGAVNTLTPVYNVDNTVYLAKPSIASATYDKGTANWTVMLNGITAGAYTRYATGASPVTAPATELAGTKYDEAKGIVTNAAEIAVSVLPNIGVTASNAVAVEVHFLSNAAQFATFDGIAAGGDLEYYVGKSTAKWLEQDAIKAAIDAGKAVKKNTGYATQADWDKAEMAAVKAVYEATIATAKAELAKYADGAMVVVGEKAYTIKAADLKTATDGLAKVEADAAKVEVVTGYVNVIDAAVAYTNNALKTATEVKGITKADIEAAAAVTASLKAAATAEAAEAALAQYAALTDAQKKLVDAADVAAAQKVVDEAKAAAELKEAQDDAAVSKARSASKTVKAGKNGKTTKKQSVTLKKITSASGAKVTYKKISGKKAITVKSGKAYLAKGVKKGTYKATVKATCGTQTAKIKVTFKVK